MPRITVPMPRGESENTPIAGLAGPYIAWCLSVFPDSDATTFIFAIHGLADDASVEWTSRLGDSDVVQGSHTRHVYVITFYGGGGGTVTATVNGQVLGTIPYGSANVAGCFG